MSDDQRFEEAYATHVAPHLPNLEALQQTYRRKRLTTALIISAVGAAVAIAAIAGLFGSGGAKIIIFLIAVIAVGIGWLLVYSKFAERYRAVLKERVMNVVCQLVGEMEWSGKSTSHFVVSACQEIGVVPKGTQQVSDFLNAGADALVAGGELGVDFQPDDGFPWHGGGV